MLITAINGSPNLTGNTAFLLSQALQECREMDCETAIINCQEALRGLKTPFCKACSSPCTAKCLEGKELQKAYDLLSRSDGIIAGSPVYFGTVSGQFKAFWDKSRSLRTGKKLLNIAGGALTVGGSRFGGQETTLRAIHDIFLVQGMIIVGDGYYENDCGHLGAAGQRPAEEDNNAILRARILGRRVAQVARATQNIRSNYVK